MTLEPAWSLELPRARIHRFTPLLQRGVGVRASAGRSVAAFLTGDLGLAPDYVGTRIATVFLDDQVVDDIEEARLRAGSRLALSAAMPGLVGATLRRGGHYAAMRAAITRVASAAPAPPERPATIQVAVFNLLLAEVGPALLARGVLVGREEARDLAGDAPGEPPGAGPVALRVRFA
ncbi:MAG: hypothetical protein HZB56_16910 [Deltaproteobacteria bacterium]|nr:hypothetical protein [Deltaproteobacteria bacterium]